MPQEENHSRVVNNNTRSKSIPYIPTCISPLIFILLDSFKVIFLQHPKFFLIIYTLGALPLSVLVTSLSISSTPRRLKSHIGRLEWLYHIVEIWVEAGNVKETAHRDVKELFCFQILYALPVYVFSLFTVVTTVTAICPLGGKKKPTLRAAVTAFRVSWTRPTMTCIVIVIFWIMLGCVVPTLTTALGYPRAVYLVVVVAAAEIYAMAVFSLALVVSVAEELSGVDAIRAGSGMMKGRRVFGWALSGLVLLGSNCIGREMVGVLDGEDLMGVNGGYKWTVEMRMVYMIGLVVLLGWIVMWSYVVVTVFYCDCKKRNVVVIRDDNVNVGDIQI